MGTVTVGASEFTVHVQSSNGRGELRHRMQISRKSAQHGYHVLGNIRPPGPFFAYSFDLRA